MPPPQHVRRSAKRPYLTDNNHDKVSLSRALSKLGYCSRTQASRLIAEGRVSINGRPALRENIRVNPDTEPIAVDGTTISASKKIYLMLHKPRGIVTTRDDPQGRPTVYDLLPSDLPFLSPVGRLDKASEGLLLFTNDTKWSDYLLSPSSQIAKTYHVKIDRIADIRFLHALSLPITDKGETLNAASVHMLRSSANSCWLEVVLTEGRNRQVRRIMASQGAEVLRLVRVDIGGISLGGLKKRTYRALTAREVKSLSQPVPPPERTDGISCSPALKSPAGWSPI